MDIVYDSANGLDPFKTYYGGGSNDPRSAIGAGPSGALGYSFAVTGAGDFTALPLDFKSRDGNPYVGEVSDGLAADEPVFIGRDLVYRVTPATTGGTSGTLAATTPAQRPAAVIPNWFLPALLILGVFAISK